MDQSLTGTEITRREALRKGLMLGGAVLWTTPVVQAIGISPALASETSTTCCFHITLTVKNSEVAQGGTLKWHTDNCNCGTHADDDNPHIEIRMVSSATVLKSYDCAVNDPGECTGQDNSAALPSDLGPGTYEVEAVVSGTQGGNFCSATSNKVTITVT